MNRLRIGVFFDGTGNNAYNYLLNKPDNEIKEQKCDGSSECEKTTLFRQQCKEETIVPEAGYTIHASASYNNPPTNIWYLYKHYETGKTELGHQIGIYVTGCGTYEGEEDDTVTMGIGYNLRPDWKTLWLKAPCSPCHHTGVIDKTDTAIELIGNELNKLKKELEEAAPFDSIEYELFGFSRGATSARHFANRIANKDKDLVKVVNEKLGKTRYPSIESEPVGFINFIGLFDSVAAILALTNKSLNINDSNTGKVKIDLSNVNAKHVFHLTAGHEMRYNFSLNRTLPLATAWELELPGVHSDIGGGYDEVCEERLFISPPFYSEERSDTKYFDTKAYANAKQEMDNLLQHTKWGAIWREGDVKVVCWNSAGRRLHHAIHDTKLFGAAVIMRRLDIHTGIATVAMHAMRDYSVQVGGSLFKELGYDQNIQTPKIPEDLMPLREAVRAKMLKHLEAGGDNDGRLDSLVDALPTELAKKYIHCSAYYEAIDASLKVLDWISPKYVPKTFAKKITLTFRPTDNMIRSEYDGTGKEYKRYYYES